MVQALDDFGPGPDQPREARGILGPVLEPGAPARSLHPQSQLLGVEPRGRSADDNPPPPAAGAAVRPGWATGSDRRPIPARSGGRSAAAPSRSAVSILSSMMRIPSCAWNRHAGRELRSWTASIRGSRRNFAHISHHACAYLRLNHHVRRRRPPWDRSRTTHRKPRSPKKTPPAPTGSSSSNSPIPNRRRCASLFTQDGLCPCRQPQDARGRALAAGRHHLCAQRRARQLRRAVRRGARALRAVDGLARGGCANTR